MEFERLLTELEAGHARMPVPAVVGPLLGLAYILVLPIIGVAVLVVAGGIQVARALAATAA